MNNVVCGPGAGAEGGGAGGESFYGNIPVQIRKEIMLKTLLDQRRQYIGGLCTKHCSVHKWLYTEYTQYYTPCFDGEKPPPSPLCDSPTERPRQPNALSYCFLYDSTHAFALYNSTTPVEKILASSAAACTVFSSVRL